MSDSSPEPEDLETRKPEVIDVDADSDVEEVHTVEVEEMERESSAEVIFRKNNFQSSTKLDALMRDLRESLSLKRMNILKTTKDTCGRRTLPYVQLFSRNLQGSWT